MIKAVRKERRGQEIKEDKTRKYMNSKDTQQKFKEKTMQKRKN